MSKLLIVIPAHNEEANIVQVVEELTRGYPQYDYVAVSYTHLTLPTTPYV